VRRAPDNTGAYVPSTQCGAGGVHTCAHELECLDSLGFAACGHALVYNWHKADGGSEGRQEQQQIQGAHSRGLPLRAQGAPQARQDPKRGARRSLYGRALPASAAVCPQESCAIVGLPAVEVCRCHSGGGVATQRPPS
jgi:hypothetical protein